MTSQRPLFSSSDLLYFTSQTYPSNYEPQTLFPHHNSTNLQILKGKSLHKISNYNLNQYVQPSRWGFIPHLDRAQLYSLPLSLPHQTTAHPTQIVFLSCTLQKQIFHLNPQHSVHITLYNRFLTSFPEQISTTTAIMGAQDVLSRKTGVIVGDDVLALFKYAQEHKFAIPAIVSPHHSMRTLRDHSQECISLLCKATRSQLIELLILCKGCDCAVWEIPMKGAFSGTSLKVSLNQHPNAS